MVINQLMKMCSGVLVLLLPIMSSVGYTHGVQFGDSLLDQKALCMSRCLKIGYDGLRKKCEEFCDEPSTRNSKSHPTCPIGQFYDPDYEQCDECDSICLYRDTQDLCDSYCPDYASEDYGDDDYDNDDYDDDDYGDENIQDIETQSKDTDYPPEEYEDFDSDDEIFDPEDDMKDYHEKNSNEEDRFKLETQREETDYDADDYDDVYTEDDTFKHQRQMKNTESKTKVRSCPTGQFYDPDYEKCDDCDSICLYTDTQDLCDTYCPDWNSEDYEDIGSADIGSGKLDDELEPSDVDHSEPLTKNIKDTTDDKETPEMWFENSSDIESTSKGSNNTNSSIPGEALPYSELKSNKEHQTEKTPSALLYSGVFLGGALVAFLISILALTLWKPFRNNIKHLLLRKKDTSLHLLPYRSPIVRNGPESFTSERESFL